jgi:hypothetical protein
MWKGAVMDELPREARELLALARDAHDPPEDGARDRVKRGVLVAAAAGGGAAALASKAVASAASSAATGAAKGGLFASASAKMFLAGSALVVASAVTVAVPRMVHKRQSTEHQAERARKPRTKPSHTEPSAKVVAPEQASAPSVEAEASAEPAPQVPNTTAGLLNGAFENAAQKLAQRPAARVRTRPVTPSLQAEMRLLSSASDAISAHELGRARTLLAQHRKTFPHGQLRAEREALLALAACSDGGASAQKQARAFLAKEPDAVLAARLRSACKLE